MWDLGARVYFATPYHSGERGLNENTNSLVREYLHKGMDFLKGMDFPKVSAKQIQVVEGRINDRPHKDFGYRATVEVFAKQRVSLFKIKT
ncbi:MAG: hypothetical protein OXE78_08960 [Gammaproteobacteria bacterium]|nr:hypothetical protein [Gammaproteobacteria bacterium]MCY4358730.1 hypothetical protein [Gammaproteobacteria bacterium]